ncbi:DNA-binding response OmpR family regulator [Azospirillum fermentarium]|uniref:response regulator transcription factor n=1 Tax=Azospirillum fermentarium TaxID=1233114 RepID=UPI00222718C4|nr:response regulator transcription factor [Azospirillum fermentarium]MCW2247749.1 DNA-binding response OmpR family regulator [Azospirillum fermentarium]
MGNAAIIVVVEDEGFLRESLVEFLTIRGYRAEGAASRAAAEKRLEAGGVDLLLLDVNLPDGNGFALARRVRERSGMAVGIIILTCRGTTVDRVMGLDSGADAYLVKEADLLEIDATVRSVLRRLPAAPDRGEAAGWGAPCAAAPQAGGGVWALPPQGMILRTPGGAVVPLTASEHAFLMALLRRPGEPMPREEIAMVMERLPNWTLRNLDSLVRRLRHKIRDATGESPPLRMVYGIGYSLDGDWET